MAWLAGYSVDPTLVVRICCARCSDEENEVPGGCSRTHRVGLKALSG